MFYNNQDKQPASNLPQELESLVEKQKSYRVYTYAFFDSSIAGAGDQVVSAGFQVSPPFINVREVSFKSVSFVVIATDATTSLNYDVTDKSFLQLQQFDRSSFTPLGTAVGLNDVYVAGVQQDKQFGAGEFKLYGAAINVGITTPSGSKGFVAAGNWSITVYVTIEFWYGN